MINSNKCGWAYLLDGLSSLSDHQSGLVGRHVHKERVRSGALSLRGTLSDQLGDQLIRLEDLLPSSRDNRTSFRR